MRISDLLHFLRQIFFPNWKPEEIDENAEPSRLALWVEAARKRFRSKESVGTMFSVLLHLLILFLLSIFLLPDIRRDGLGDILGGSNQIPAELAKPNDADDIDLETERPPNDDSAQRAIEETPQPMEAEATEPSVGDSPEAAPSVEPGETEAAPTSGQHRDFVPGGGFEGRTPENRTGTGGLAGNDGGAGENTVEAGLAWLARHQNRDGGWNFDIQCCANGGVHTSRTAATALAVLPFLGAGYTHERGKYQKVVEDGLFFLLSRGVTSEGSNTVDFREGSDRAMYPHGLAAIVLCEAHAMSRRKLPKLREAAQGAIDLIEREQDQRLGGWRYPYPIQTPDISVSAWQVMALKSAKLADLHVARQTVYGVSDFLEALEMDGGRRYNYQPERTHFSGRLFDSPLTSSATGLLLRMYIGWEPGEKMLDEGIDMIAQAGPLRPCATDCCPYYAYYATLAMHHYGGSNWNRWADDLSEFLVRSQSRSGHESGSWHFPDECTAAGGRLLHTALAILILETPYRILPLYRKP